MNTEWPEQRRIDYFENFGINNNTRKLIRSKPKTTASWLIQHYNYNYVMENMKK